MYTLKTIARRSTALGMAVSLLVAAILPGASAFAQSALNPLTERSLLLSSSAPGYIDTDGSGYSTANPNPSGDGPLDTITPGQIPDTYAPAGSGPNGMKTGETFSFKVSTTSGAGELKGMSFQYCTTAAGLCRAPGNNNGDFRGEVDDPGPPIDWDMVSDREANGGPGGAHENQRSDLDVIAPFAQAGFGDDAAIDPVAGEFQIYVGGNPIAVDDWTMVVRNVEDIEWVNGGDALSDGLTGKRNFITLSSPTGIAAAAGTKVDVVFKASESIYITNPGAGSFFVKINTYSSANEAAHYVDSIPPATNGNIIDGGVTVANVMTDSIHIVTKVLETMSFSVGIENPDTINLPGVEQHGRCEPMSQTSSITGLTNNRLNLGNENAEYSLEVNKAYDVFSYWRLSSNSSGGATVYYSGNTLANTSGDKIAPMDDTGNPLGVLSNPGTEQFGLGFVDAGLDTFANDVGGVDPDTFQSGWVPPRSYPFITLATQTSAPYDALAAQTGSDGYKNATGRINTAPDLIDPINNPPLPIEARFRFFDTSLTIPEVIAEQKEMVISCATAKMRYVANIGADTPAGVYTTKINYLAAPQY